jgi:predicted amidohydrolase
MKIALIQICSVLDPEANLSKIQELINSVKKEDSSVEHFFLPEVFYSMSDGTEATPFLVESGNEHFKKIQNIAIENKIYLLGGTAATKVGSKIINRSYNFSPNGKEICEYDKINLFAVNLKESKTSTVIDEAIVYSAGDKLKSFTLGGFNFGLTICFDLRFPEMFREYFKRGVNVYSVSSAFTYATGKAHWETLLRARAIENQAYVIACNQWGKHNEKFSTYGHSMVIDPWGEVIANCEEGERYSICEISLERIEKIRGRMNISPRT